MDLAYVAHSERCALLLDGEGVCRWVVPKREESDGTDPSIGVARRCVGAQFVASLDIEVDGLLGQQPRIGATLLFACVNDGRVSLVRFGPLTAFDALDADAGAASMLASVRPIASTTSVQAPMSVSEAIADLDASEPVLGAFDPGVIAERDPVAERDPMAELDAIAEVAQLEAIAGPRARESSPLTVRVPQPITQKPIAEAAPSEVDLEAATDPDDAKEEEAPSVDLADPFGRISSPAVASFLRDVSEIAEAPFSRSSIATDSGARATEPLARAVDATDDATVEPDAPGADADDQHTNIFTRALEDLFANPCEMDTRVPSAADSEVEIMTGSFARASESVQAAAPAASPDPLAVRRPSGFVMRTPGSAYAEEELVVNDADQETCRFARVAGQEPTPITKSSANGQAQGQPRRGILPRRFSR